MRLSSSLCWIEYIYIGAIRCRRARWLRKPGKDIYYSPIRSNRSPKYSFLYDETIEQIFCSWPQTFRIWIITNIETILKTSLDWWHYRRITRRDWTHPKASRNRAHSLSKNMGASMHSIAHACRQSRTHASYAITPCHGPRALNLI